MDKSEQINQVMMNLKDNKVAQENGWRFSDQLAKIRGTLAESSPGVVQKIDSLVQKSLPALQRYKDGADNQSYADFLDGIQKYANVTPKNETKLTPQKDNPSEEAQLSDEIKNTFRYFKK